MENKSNKNLYVITPEMVVVSAFHNTFPQFDDKGLVNKIKNRQRIKDSVNFYDLVNMCQLLNILGPKYKIYCDLNVNDLLKYLRRDWKFFRVNKPSVNEEVFTELSRTKITEIYNTYNLYIRNAMGKAIKINDIVKQKKSHKKDVNNATVIEPDVDVNKDLEK